MTEKYDRSIWENIGDISICENTTVIGTCGNNMTGTCGGNMTGTCEKIIIMATRTYEKIDDRNIGKNRNHMNIWENTTGIYEKNRDDRNI